MCTLQTYIRSSIYVRFLQGHKCLKNIAEESCFALYSLYLQLWANKGHYPTWSLPQKFLSTSSILPISSCFFPHHCPSLLRIWCYHVDHYRDLSIDSQYIASHIYKHLLQLCCLTTQLRQPPIPEAFPHCAATFYSYSDNDVWHKQRKLSKFGEANQAPTMEPHLLLHDLTRLSNTSFWTTL